MTDKFKLVKSEPHIENIETGECYDLDSDNFSYIVKVMNELSNENEKLKQENEKLKQPNCRNCIHFSCDNADIYCMEKGYDSIPNCSIAKDCDEYEGLYE